ncbi:hypothetical protein SARC_06486 [Sphaeroforma arctica JP610]|uniref:Uncharacterized protein n=1 Tax=Sphaeroforma arctica JP610 TaxID=667725 RepID=A0A0L0FWG7_9EUKA|nr:hypothetical protein SARC_06486 [Sphaeroforma arctica JP610]KNC81175.1 hypothetical protein SARC_06486 [Sphaeroforma arctica JP610]|eukprot:XP_014155077.1 hypothetical protein SARC_06486 [Sphaeroforma arctica JP610]
MNIRVKYWIIVKRDHNSAKESCTPHASKTEREYRSGVSTDYSATTYITVPRLIMMSQRTSASSTKQKAALYVPRSSRRRKIAFEVEVEYAENDDAAVLQVYQGDDLKKIAQDFGRSHHMSAQNIKALAVYLRQKSTDLRTKG